MFESETTGYQGQIIYMHNVWPNISMQGIIKYDYKHMHEKQD